MGVKTLLCLSASGVADRIRLLVAGRKLAQTAGRHFGMAWLRNHDCGADFDNLFEMQDSSVTDKMPEAIASCYFDGYTWSRMPWEFVERQIRACEADHITLHSFADDQPHDFWNHGIQFACPIIDAASEWCSRHLPLRGHMIGCHVRRTDKNPIPAIEEYRAALDALVASQKHSVIFLTTDDLEIRPLFQHWYKDRLVFFEHPAGIQRHTVVGAVEAMIELRILQQCRSLALTAQSGFSMMAIRSESTVKGQGVRVVYEQ